MYGYIYKTTCLVTHKIYVGQHGSQEFTQKYLGSGTLLLKDVKRFGRDSFVVELLDSAESAEELSAKEQYWILALSAQDPQVGYNLSKGGPYGARGWHHSLETRELMSVKNSGRVPWITGKHHTDATKEKWKAQRFGVRWMNNGVVSCRVRPEDCSAKLALGYCFGRLPFRNYEPFTEEHRRKLSLARKGKHLSEERKHNISVGLSLVKDSLGAAHRGKCCINKEGERKWVFLVELPVYLAQGWQKGIRPPAPKPPKFSWTPEARRIHGEKMRARLYSPKGRKYSEEVKARWSATHSVCAKGYIQPSYARINVSLGSHKLTLSQALEKGMRIWKRGEAFSVSLLAPKGYSSSIPWVDATDDVQKLLETAPRLVRGG